MAIVTNAKKHILSRNFVFFNDLDSYLNVLTTKITKSSSEYDLDSLNELFKTLESLKETDEKQYELIIEELSNYTEEFVVTNATIISKMIDSKDNEMEDIASLFGYDKNSEAIKSIGIIVDKYNEIIERLCNKIIENTASEQISEVALDVRKDDEFVSDVYLELLCECPVIADNLLLQELELDMEKRCGSIAYNYMTSVRKDIFKKKENYYEEYSKNASKQRVRKRARGQNANPRPLGFRNNR